MERDSQALKKSKREKDGNDKDITKKKAWFPEEDLKLKELIGQFGPTRWTLIAEHLENRSGKQCRERWWNHLHPEVNIDRKSTRLNSSHIPLSRMPSSA